METGGGIAKERFDFFFYLNIHLAATQTNASSFFPLLYLQRNVEFMCRVCKFPSLTPVGAGVGVNDRSS